MTRSRQWPRLTRDTAIVCTGIAVILWGGFNLDPGTVYAGVAVIGSIFVVHGVDRSNDR